MKKCFFDIETTSANKETCGIVQLAIHLVDEQGNILLSKSKLYNPGVPMEQSAIDVTGITDKMLKNAPTFEEDAKQLKKIFENSELIGYNIIAFDIPILMRHFDRAGVSLELSGQVIDVMKLETALNPRTLGAVYKRYTGEEMENAHDAMGDVKATSVILQHQLERIMNDDMDLDKMMEAAGIPPGSADFFGKFRYDDEGFLVYNFGKHLNRRILADSDTRKYADWMLGEAFPGQVKKLIKEELKKDVASQFKKADKSETKGDYYTVTQEMIRDHNRTGKSFDKLQSEKTGFSFKSKQGEMDFDLPDDDLPF